MGLLRDSKRLSKVVYKKMKKIKNRNAISAKTKSLILTEAALPGCIISKLAKSYNISKATIYTWLKKGKIGARGKDNINDDSSKNKNFVEVIVEDIALVSNIKHNLLQKASLEFEDLNIAIEGKIATSKLISIFQLLEEKC